MMSCIEMLFSHNLTARWSVLDVLDTMESEDFLRDFGEGIGSIRDITVHIIDTEKYWISILKGEKIVHLLPTDYTTANAIKKSWHDIEGHTKEFLRDLNKDELSHVRSSTYEDSTIYFTVSQALIHLVTHEIHHRGLIVGLLRQLGLDAPDVNML
jgi:uncharacterized damage-inducible protein DinB